MRRNISLAIALVGALLMAVAMSVPAFALGNAGGGGNNGTIMVNGYDLASNGNDPHISCPLVTQFSGFDTQNGQHTVTVAIKSVSPVGNGPPAGTAVPYSPAAQNFSGATNTQTFMVDFTGFDANNKGEYHVNITVSVSTANNTETKSKTFWMKACGTPLQLSGACETSGGNNTGNVLWTLTNPAGNPTVSSIAYSADTNNTQPAGTVAGSIAPGGNTTWTTAPFTGNLTATASGSGQTLASNDAASPTACPIAPAGSPNLTVDKSDAVDPVTVGDNVTYYLDVTNTGTADTDGTTVTVSDTLPLGMTKVSASGTNWDCSTSTSTTITCTTTSVIAKSGGTAPRITVVASTTGMTAGTVSNTAGVSGGGDGTNSTDTESTTLNAQAGAKTMSMTPSCNSTNGVVTWTVSTNPSTSGVAANVSGPSVNPTSVTTGAGGTATFTSTAGNVTLSPTTAGWSGPANAVASGPCSAPQPGAANVGLTKDVNAGNGAIVQPGQQLVYTLTYTNTGSAAATNVSITDALPANSTFVSIADGGTYDAGAKLASWTIASVAPGATGAVHWTVQVASGLPAGSAVTNVAMLGSAPTNTVTNPVASGDLTLGKAVDRTSAEFGDTLTYTLTAAATGAQDRTGVRVIDTMPDGTTYVAGSATCGTGCPSSYDSATRTLTWTVGDLKAGDSVPLTFQVTVDTPTPAADGSIPGVLVTNRGFVNSAQDPDLIPSNQVTTAITAVLGVKITRKPPVVKPPVVAPPVVSPSKLPYTGATFPVALLVQVGGALVLLGGLMLVVGRRRELGRHSV